MTCMKQEFCIHEKYCQRHIGQNFDSCILFSRNSKPMTNEEYLKSLDTKQLARIIYELMWHKEKYHELCVYPVVDSVVEWLKQPHT